MENVEQTIISQYANSATIVQLVQNMNQYIDQTTNFQAFYDYVWNVNTAVGFGLDVWGRIVDVSRNLLYTPTQIYFGFYEQFDSTPGATNPVPFNNAPFSPGPAATSVYTMGDAEYRTLILAKAFANISNVTAGSINALLRAIFGGGAGDILGVGTLPFRLAAGRAYVLDTGGMQYTIKFEFTPTPIQLAIVTNSGVFPRPAGVALLTSY